MFADSAIVEVFSLEELCKDFDDKLSYLVRTKHKFARENNDFIKKIDYLTRNALKNDVEELKQANDDDELSQFVKDHMRFYV